MRGLAILFAISYLQIGVKMAHADGEHWYLQRQAMIEKLRSEPNKSLVIVKYDANHNPNREWVYNDADLPNAKVILARDMGPDANRQLADYYGDRKAWVVNADAPEPQLEPFR